MALALITDVRDGPAGPVLRVDTGTNPWFRWRVGSHRVGRDELDGISHESPVQRRTGTGAFQTAFDLPLDSAHLDRSHRYVQVLSYKTADGRSPAWSDVHSVHGYGADRVADMTNRPRPTALTPARSVSFSAVEPTVSGALFWGELLAVVDALAPLAMRLLQGGNGGTAGPPDVASLLTPLLDGLARHVAGSAPATPAAVPAAPTPAAPTPAAPTPAPAAGGGRPPVASGMDFGVISVPVLLGLLTALGPGVLQALTPLLQRAPELLEVVADQPVKLINAVAEAHRQDELLADQQVQRLLSSGDQHLLLNLLRDAGRSPAVAPVPVTASLGGYRIRPRVTARAHTVTRELHRGPQRRIDPRVEVALLPPQPRSGPPARGAWYSAQAPLQLQLQLGARGQTPDRPVPHPVVHLRIRRAATAATLLERHIELPPVHLGRPVGITLTPDDTAALPRGTDLTVSADVTWTGRDGAAYTTPTRATLALCLVGEHIAASLGARRPVELALSDPGRFRPFWHQVWEGGSAEHRRWELDVTARYYYRLTATTTANGRMDTRIRPIAERSRDTGDSVRWGGFLKSGMELAVSELNALLPDVGLPAWTEAELAALQSGAVARLTGRQATTRVRLRGRGTQRGSAWVFPVLEVVEIDLHRVTAVAPDGSVQATEARNAPFLLPGAAVFVGMTTEG